MHADGKAASTASIALYWPHCNGPVMQAFISGFASWPDPTGPSWQVVGKAVCLTHETQYSTKLGQLEADLAHVQAVQSKPMSAIHPLDLLALKVQCSCKPGPVLSGRHAAALLAAHGVNWPEIRSHH